MPSYQDVHRVADQLRPSLRSDLLDAFARARQHLPLRDLQDALINKRVPDDLGAIEAMLRAELTPVLDKAYRAAMARTGGLATGAVHGARATSEPASFVDAQVKQAHSIVCLVPPLELAAALAVPGGEEPHELHVSLVVMGDELTEEQADRIRQILPRLAHNTAPLVGEISGTGRFSGPDRDVYYASPDVPGLAEFRQRVCAALDANGIDYFRSHGFTPHITLRYIEHREDAPGARFVPMPVAFGSVWFWHKGMAHSRYPFAGQTMMFAEGDQPSIVGHFDINNERAQAFVDQYAGDLVTGITEDVRAGIRAILAGSFEGEYDVRRTAMLMSSMVGLNDRQAGAVARMYQGGLAIPGNADNAAHVAQDYAARLLRQRADTIARTETIRAANAGVNEGFVQAQESGLLGRGATKVWIVTPDDKLCDDCEAMDGEEVGLDEAFSDGEDAPPDHPDCRCAVGIGDTGSFE
jgi:2'-5' RNA ligase